MQEKIRVAGVPAVVAGILTIVYAATLAPSVTLWDAGEFLSAIHSLGIPHPPGTPLYIVIAAAWARLFAPLFGFARAVNLLSALATVAACAVLGARVARWMSSRVAGIAAGVAAGSMLSVWRSATETEVYALSLALAVIALAVADRAGMSGRWRDSVLTVYVLALSVPLHLSALVVVPGVVAFAATDTDGNVQIPKGIMIAGAALLAMALGTTLTALAAGGVLVLIVGSLTRRAVNARVRLRDAAPMIAVVLLAASAVAVMYLRAQYDPFVNQGNPATIDGVLGVVGREQYDVPPLWPRRAPFWLQLGNLVQYSDWQVAFGLDQWVGASLRRTPFTLLFVILAIAGGSWHRVRDRRSFRAFAVTLTSASLGAVLVLNLRAGPSFGVGILPPDALHEARERDYFFAIAFALAAAWAGIGATRFGAWVARRVHAPLAAPVVALVIAGAPIALNWRAADRSAGGRATLARDVAAVLLDSLPPRAVLLVAGDNDTYPLWYLQRVEGRRRDVTVVTIPLLPATWYRLELQRRHDLLAGSVVDAWRGLQATIDAVAERAGELERPLTVAASVAARQRETLGDSWIAQGMAFIRRVPNAELPLSAVGVRVASDTLIVVSRDATQLFIDTLANTPALPRLLANHRAWDPTEAYMAVLLGCPAQIRSAVRARRGSVDPRCNLR